MNWFYYTPPDDSGGVLWFHVGCPCVCLSISSSSICLSVCISVPDDNLSKHYLIFTKHGMFIDIVEIWFGIAYGQILSNFDRVICRDTSIFLFPDNYLSKCQGILTRLGTCIDIKEIWFWIANGQMVGYYCFTFLFSQKIGSYISCKLSPEETVCMKCQILLSWINKENIPKFYQLKFLPSKETHFYLTLTVRNV